VQEPNRPLGPLEGPHIWPLGHVPPHAGVSETKQVEFGLKHVHASWPLCFPQL